VDTIVYSGFTNASNPITTTSSLGTKTVNTWWRYTNIPELIDNGTISGTRSGWFNSNGSFNNNLFPNAIDPGLVYDSTGKLWMTYGSWSGGIFILEINKATGKPYHPGVDNGDTDRYFGKKIAGGYTKSGEAPYIVYDSATGYYYLYVSYGWLGNSGGYHIRLYRSTSINGTYTDAAGNSAVYASSTVNQSNYGIKLFGNYNFSGLPIGYKSGGHNSALIDTDGLRYLVYHTRFDNGTEGHEVRVHQQFMNADNWPVTAVYEFLGSSISPTGYSATDMTGTYQFVDMGLDASTSNVGMLPTQSVTLNSNGTITGGVTGTWSSTAGTYNCTMVIGGITYKGVFFKQRNELSTHNEVMTFSLIGSNNKAIWGSK
jgi:arabinan endo-1,5-alpha-L-arabinosidase